MSGSAPCRRRIRGRRRSRHRCAGKSPPRTKNNQRQAWHWKVPPPTVRQREAGGPPGRRGEVGTAYPEFPQRCALVDSRFNDAVLCPLSSLFLVPLIDSPLPFIIGSLVCTAAPGPDNLAILSLGLTRGRRAGIGFAIGCALG